jgi:hypothetical protein
VNKLEINLQWKELFFEYVFQHYHLSKQDSIPNTIETTANYSQLWIGLD